MTDARAVRSSPRALRTGFELSCGRYEDMRRKRAVESIRGNIKTLHLRDIQERGSENTFVGKFKKEGRQDVTIVQVVCNKFNCITIVKGDELFASSGGNQLTVWDLSLEKDEEEEAEFKAYTKEQLNMLKRIKTCLFSFFSFTRDKDLKELHWHNQIPGMIISTAFLMVSTVLMPYNM
ncbi:hypothetical protein Bca52824_002572 [Brassica carinata]|uniref:Uncharacterized protein n=1 Tax=Brassica carinata TaxID=52824 RepID=A0A8X8BEZ9_BRACI|nr:hypothetical protein Bca52824_002572 [Brassica carinata]